MKKFLPCVVFALVVAGCSKESTNDGWYEPVIPVSLVGIEAVNIDNSGELPFITASPVKKDAYMVGIKWITDNAPSDDDKFITGPIRRGEQTYSSLGSQYSKAVICNTPFNSSIPAGTYVSKYFKEISSHYLPTGVDEGFVLLVAPDAGQHSFRVEYYDGNTLLFFYDTQPINFY